MIIRNKLAALIIGVLSAIMVSSAQASSTAYTVNHSSIASDALSLSTAYPAPFMVALQSEGSSEEASCSWRECMEVCGTREKQCYREGRSSDDCARESRACAENCSRCD